jgi:hypothetical protein
MSSIVIFWIVFVVLTISVLYCNKKYCMLKDTSAAARQPYSWARVQLAWWTIIVLTSFITIIIEFNQAPGLNTSTVILLGISAATITTAKVIDVSDETDPNIVRHQDGSGTNFILDILSDQNNVSISRFQTVVFNFVFGLWFITFVIESLPGATLATVDSIMPVIDNNNLVLLGLSSATYAAIKTTENKSNSAEAEKKTAAAAAETNFEEQPVG